MDYEPIDGEVIRETDLAVLVRLDDESEVWIPRSVCEGGDDLVVGDEDILVAHWFAEREGL